MSFLTLGILAATAFFAGLVDSIAGGGGILTIPVLISVGVPPHLALGTNKFQASFGSLTAAYNYSRKNLVTISHVWQGILFTALGAMTGTLVVRFMSAGILNHAIPVWLLVLFLYFLLSPDLGKGDTLPRIKENRFYILCGLGLGFYDGFFGPGTGNFWAAAFVMLMGFNMKKATAHTKVMNFTSNIVSLVTFMFLGLVDYKIGLTMAGAQILGARIGSGLVIRHGAGFVRIFFLIVVGLTILKLISSTYF